MITLPKTISTDACEKFLLQLANKKDVESLQLPVDTTSYAFGGIASAVQSVNTWARVSETRQLILKQSASRDEIEEVMKNPQKFVAAMYAKSISLANAQSQDLRPKINEAARLAVEKQAIQRAGQQRGRLCWFAFVDHSSKGFDPNFYIDKGGERPVPRQLEQFKTVIRTMVDRSMTIAAGAKELEREKLDYAGRIFYELFLNTHEHGTRGSSRQEWLRPGVRLIYSYGINLDEAATRNATFKQPILANYLAAAASKNPLETQRRYVEIGIVDSGLGYCGRWLADHPVQEDQATLDIDHEYEIFRKCFRFRQTSTGIDSKGHGLPAVMDRLTKLGGFMRVRSGRLELFRDFLTSPHMPDDACHFSDWSSGQSAELTLTPKPYASGVAISLLIPLEAKS